MITIHPLTEGRPCLSLTEMRQQVRQDSSEDDGLLLQYEVAARNHIRLHAGIVMSSQQFRMQLDGFPERAVRLPVWPVIAIASISYFDGDVWKGLEPGSWRAELERNPALIIPRGTWPCPSAEMASVKIDVSAGFASAADLPDTIRAAALLLVEQLYEKHSDFTGTIDQLLRHYASGMGGV